MIWFRKKAGGLQSRHPELRAALVCEDTLAQLAYVPDDDPDTAEARFAAARASVLVGDRATARRHLHELFALPTAGTQVQVLAWNCLRELDELPAPATATVVRGVVVDIGTAAGLDTLAAYQDHTAHLLLADGSVRNTDVPHGAFVDAIDRLLTAAQGVVAHTHPHRGAAENPPERSHACIRVLTFAGTHIGLGPTATLERDPIGGPVLMAANALQRALVDRHSEHSR